MQGPVTLVLFAVVLEVLTSQAHSGQLVTVVGLDRASPVNLEKVKLSVCLRVYPRQPQDLYL